MTNSIINANQDSLDFLWFSYFNITQKEAASNTEVALNKSIQRAYRDVCRTFHYTFSSGNLENLKKKDKDKYEEYLGWKEKFREDISTYITRQIGKLKIQSQEDFDAWHAETCDEIVLKAKGYSSPDKQLFAAKNKKREGSEGNVFFYGQAQKWLNMTLKYMLIMGLWEEELTEKKKYFHVPVDSFIMGAAGISVPCKDKNGWTWGEYSESKSKVWSQWEKEEYTEFQKALRDKLSKDNTYPMEWEGSAWIRVAMVRESKV